MTEAEQRAAREALAALGRFDRWAADHPIRVSPAEAVAAAGRLYELLPVDSRQRPIDASGVIVLHGILARIGRR
jgi:hypothetical protein